MSETERITAYAIYERATNAPDRLVALYPPDMCSEAIDHGSSTYESFSAAYAEGSDEDAYLVKQHGIVVPKEVPGRE